LNTTRTTRHTSTTTGPGETMTGAGNYFSPATRVMAGPCEGPPGSQHTPPSGPIPARIPTKINYDLTA
jgi:hypothetical protein